jgi:hypothetical protein
MLLIDMLKYWAWVVLGKLFFFKHCMGALRYVAICKEPNSFGVQWGKTPT